MISKMETIEIHPARVGRPQGTRKTGGRQKGTANLVTRDIRATLRDLAEGNAVRVQAWFDAVAAKDPGEALKIWLALLRFVTPTLQAAAISDVTPKSISHRLAAMSDGELLEAIAQSPKRSAPIKQGVTMRDELSHRTTAPETVPPPIANLSADELLR